MMEEVGVVAGIEHAHLSVASRKLMLAIPFQIFCILILGTVNIALANVNPPSSESLRDTCLNQDNKTALEACEQLLIDDPRNLPVIIKKSDLLTGKKLYEDAILYMRLAANYFPNSEKVDHKLKQLISLNKEQQWAQKRKKDSQADTSSVDLSKDFQLNRIRCLRLTGTKALDACDTAIKINSNDHMLYKARAKILEELGRTEEASRDYKLWVKLNPEISKDKELTENKVVERSSQEITNDVPTDTVHIKREEKPRKIQVQPPAEKQDAVASIDTSVAQAQNKDSSNPQSEVLKTEAVQEVSSETPQVPGAPQGIVEKLYTLLKLQENNLISKDEYQRRRGAILDSVVAVPDKEPKKRGGSNTVDSTILGNYHALVIGELNYQFLPKLRAAAKDAEVVSKVLESQYGFKVKTLIDATRRDILLAMSEYRSSLTAEDNLLIYYAGHGWLDKEADSGYWLPIEAVEDNQVDWISMGTLTAAVRALEAKHVLIVADSSFSGKLARGVHISQRSKDYFTRIAKKRTRVVLTSGGLEPVLDGGGRDGHSVFASTFIEVLKDNREIIDGATLFTRIRRPVMLKAQQVPEYSDIRMAGHEGGDFIFFPLETKN